MKGRFAPGVQGVQSFGVGLEGVAAMAEIKDALADEGSQLGHVIGFEEAANGGHEPAGRCCILPVHRDPAHRAGGVEGKAYPPSVPNDPKPTFDQHHVSSFADVAAKRFARNVAVLGHRAEGFARHDPIQASAKGRVPLAQKSAI